ncbi:hypothetical protein CORC01_05989, partial [Colletotrichum orchidophilum]
GEAQSNPTNLTVPYTPTTPTPVVRCRLSAASATPTWQAGRGSCTHTSRTRADMVSPSCWVCVSFPCSLSRFLAFSQSRFSEIGELKWLPMNERPGACRIVQ